MSSRLKATTSVCINGVHITPAEVAAKAQRLRAAVVASVSELDMVEVMQTMVEQAKRGNMWAAKLLLQVIGATGPAGVGNVVQVNVGDTTPRLAPAPVEFVETDPAERIGLQIRIASLLSGRGNVPLSVIANELSVPRRNIPELLDSEWFEMTQDGARLTSAGKKEAVGNNGKVAH
jgi:hypothetical protein